MVSRAMGLNMLANRTSQYACELDVVETNRSRNDQLPLVVYSTKIRSWYNIRTVLYLWKRGEDFLSLSSFYEIENWKFEDFHIFARNISNYKNTFKRCSLDCCDFNQTLKYSSVERLTTILIKNMLVVALNWELKKGNNRNSTLRQKIRLF